MANFFDWFTEMLLGDLGGYALEFTRSNTSLIFVLACMYGLVLAYARMILKKYLPKKLKEYVESRRQECSKGKEKLIISTITKEWEEKLEKMPWYIIVPTKNELWVQFPDKNYRLTKQLPFRKEKKFMNDSELIRYWLHKEGA
ncbi:hypothetical protein GCM10007063_23650 [Lentibacillus kapialis]|uniref:Uncharacterized protein n=1 Tax=Lentibacillus kapialis TaxID=340214 RepID=A0A917PZ19_9BACI|nr:hypothetical protein [Lentibacillus kapialis]GGK00644.1 hypothetical protein GCM10007063_23650 [Lentibacillus kapialis]